MDKNTKIAIGLLCVGFLFHDYVIMRNAKAHNTLADAVRHLYENENKKEESEVFQDLIERFNDE